MESGDEDIFAISDEEMQFSAAQIELVNPVEEHLLKQLADIEGRINVATSEIAETKATIACVLNTLEWRALHGEDQEDANLDSDNEMYTAEGVPVIKKQRRNSTSSPEKILEVTSQWQCVLQEKWIIGVKLYNRSCCTLLNPRYYPYVLSTDEEIFGESMFWKLKEGYFFHSEKVNSIHPGAVVATMVLDLPTFDQEPVIKCWGIISYEIDETQFQIPLLTTELSIAETVNSSCIRFLSESEHNAILALKSTSTIEKIFNIQFSTNDQDTQDDRNRFGNKLFRFLSARTFTKVWDNVFLVKEHCSLMYCLVEVQSIDADKANIRIFARSVNQLNIILHLLQDEFPDVSVAEETDNCVEAAKALLHELEMIRDKKSILEIKEAKVITDLLIP